MIKMTSLLAGAAVLALSGAAYAGEPVALTDGVMDGITAAGGVNFNSQLVFNDDQNKVVNLEITKDIDVDLDLDGYVADAVATADARVGTIFSTSYYTLAETFTAAQVDLPAGLAQAYSQSTAALDAIGVETPGGE